ncbi:MAG: hypothetical protein AAGA95_15430 [Pseudomonadota bacterium]
MFETAPVPPAVTAPFVHTIAHPDLWLWDAWTCRDETAIHLYCLALAKMDGETLIAPAQRNSYRFHIRHFTSQDEGQRWFDRGPYMQPGEDPSRGIWSGSALPWNERLLMAYTEVRQVAADRPFVQSILLQPSDSYDRCGNATPLRLSDPERDYASIKRLGYFLPEPGVLGHRDGELGGPILAWRDPYLFSASGSLYAIWSAKIAAQTPALALMALNRAEHGKLEGELQPPIELPDAGEYTQAELPKCWFDEHRRSYFLLISACNRRHERQGDSEVNKETRLYRSDSIAGPWQPWSTAGSVLPMPAHAFGCSPFQWSADGSLIHLAAPLTDCAPQGQSLSILGRTRVDISMDSAMEKQAG